MYPSLEDYDLDNNAFKIVLYEFQHGTMSYDADHLETLFFNPILDQHSTLSDPNSDLDPDVNNQNYGSSASYCNYETAVILWTFPDVETILKPFARIADLAQTISIIGCDKCKIYDLCDIKCCQFFSGSFMQTKYFLIPDCFDSFQILLN